MITIIDLKFQGYEKTIAAFLVKTQVGPVLIETGPHSTLEALLSGIRNAGYDPNEIRHVFLTHIHLDHAGAAWYFAQNGATVYVHPKGAKHMINPEKLLLSARRIYQDEMDRLWGQLHGINPANIRVVAHKELIRVGGVSLRALFTPGHAVHHIGWQLGTVLFAGDVAGIRIDEGVVMPPCPPPDINVEDWQSSIRLIRDKRFKTLYLTHFGKIQDVKNHLTELNGRISNWANWIRPYCENEVAPEKVTPGFEKYVAKQLKAGGITGKALERYENANPSWMSVAGLMRYWKSKLPERV